MMNTVFRKRLSVYIRGGKQGNRVAVRKSGGNIIGVSLSMFTKRTLILKAVTFAGLRFFAIMNGYGC
jgi:hypothetical protein